LATSDTAYGAGHGISGYLREIYDYRNFWMSLAKLSLKKRFRRTHLGILWAMVQPLLFALTIALVFRYMFKQPFAELSIYVLSGVILWELFQQSVLLGSTAIIDAGNFIKQKRLPLAIYPLQIFLAQVATFSIGLIGLVVWILILRPGMASWLWLMAIPNIALILVCLLPVAIWASVFGTLYRDFQEAARVILMALWFLSPVFIAKSIFANPGIAVWDMVNPVSNMLQLLRAPVMYDQMPSLLNYGVVALFGLLNYAIAICALRRHERTLVYYL